MPIAVVCPSCSTRMNAPDTAAGRRTKCPKCGSAIVVPGPVPKAPAPGPARPELPIIVSSYIRKNLMPGEYLVGLTRPHWMVVVVPGSFAIFGLILGFVGILMGVPFDGSSKEVAFMTIGIMIAAAGVAMVLVGLILGLLGLVKRLTTEFSCTDRRLLIKSGLITTRLAEMPLTKIEDLLIEQGLFGKLFGYGTVVFKGSGGTVRVCKHIEAPFAFYKLIQEQVALAQKHK